MTTSTPELLVTPEIRESGQRGFFQPDRLRRDLLDSMSDHCIDVNPLLFEVPTAVQRRQIVTRIGPIVNVGNSQPSDLFGLETIELQLRSETLAAFEPLVAQFAIEVA